MILQVYCVQRPFRDPAGNVGCLPRGLHGQNRREQLFEKSFLRQLGYWTLGYFLAYILQDKMMAIFIECRFSIPTKIYQNENV